MPNFDFFTTQHLGQPCYRCLHCQFDTFERSRALEHRNLHRNSSVPMPKFPDYDLDLVIWVHREMKLQRFAGKKVVFALLTWNSRDASMFAADAIKNEAFRFNLVGIQTKLAWVDNGSSDKTAQAVNLEADWDFIRLFHSNMGASVARNAMIDYALEECADYLVMVDGDVQMIPWSGFGMLDYIQSHPDPWIGCIGLYSPNCAPKWEEEVAQDCRHIYPEMVSQDPSIAWTQYGMFKMDVFREGVRFDTAPEFMGPGWGLEDDDLCMQMKKAGYLSLNTKFFKYIHRNRSGSILHIGRDRAIQVFLARQQYLNQKWGGKLFNYGSGAVPNL